MFATTRGTLKPAKHLCLGLGLKSMTGSKKIINILNKFGHCVSYNIAEELETELAMTVKDKGCVTPEGIMQMPGLSTAVAWDNFDENTETLSGSGTLHDTVGICYQNVVEQTSTEDEASNTTEQDGTTAMIARRTRKRRSFEADDDQIEPYRKKPRIKTFDYRIRSSVVPISFQTAQRDKTWIISHYLFDNIPMWGGWNSQITEDSLPQQRIGYMENLSLPPTRLDVVAKTLALSQEVAKECNETHAVVHYDLAIAKPAMQIQAEEKPKFDNIFICFGPFHVQLAFFGALGYILDGSGGPYILTENDVLAPGSLNGFISGKHFNRCKQLHPLLSCAFGVLHFESFLAQHGDVPNALLDSLKELKESPTAQVMEILETSQEYITFMEQYEEFSNDTRSGKHGKTAMYWTMYIDLVELYLLFTRACHTNDLSLFIYCLGMMCPIFFAACRPNYARWMVRYHLNLLNMDITHPGVRQMLENGGLSIKRTAKSFARNPVDLTLEQTINADAASCLTGISAFSRSTDARKRWMITRSMRSSIVSHLLKEAGMAKQEDTSQELQAHRVKRDNEDVKKLTEGIKSTLNPFDEPACDENLYCISTGQAASDRVKNDLTHVREKGEAWCKEFTDGCFRDALRFEKPIPRRKVQNFASDALSSKIQGKDMKILELQGTRDLFGRLLYLATSTETDLRKVFQYPLTPVPLSLSNVNGAMNKTDKAALMKKLEKRVVTEDPSNCDACVVDGMFLVQSLTNLPSTFGGVAKTILNILCGLARCVHFVCDTYRSPSIKQSERLLRDSHEADIKVTGPEQKRPKDFQKALRSGKFKTSLLRFLSQEWSRDCYASQLEGHGIYFGLDDICYLFREESGRVVREIVPELRCLHEEADTRMVLHAQHISQKMDNPNIILRCSDTDVLVIFLYQAIYIAAHIWMDVGHSGTNTRRYIDVSALARRLGVDLCNALPAIHAFTGCDYTAAFMRKGKARPFDVAERSDKFLAAFSELGTSSDISTSVTDAVEEFVCILYGKPSLKNVDDVRFAIFREKYAPTNRNDPLERIKGADPSLLPPSKPVLLQKIRRTNYVASIWKNARLSEPATFEPTGNGWVLLDGQYAIHWYDGEQMPRDIAMHVDDPMEQMESEDDPIMDEFDYESDSDSE